MKATRQTKIKLRKGFQNAPLVYKVLSVRALNAKDLALVIKVLAKVNTPKQAEKLVGPASKWGFKMLALSDARVGVSTYRGVEVALFFKRMTVDVVPDPIDPVPEGALEHPEDVWVRFDLFGKSARQQLKIIRAETESQEEESNLLRAELVIKEQLIRSNISQIRGLQTIANNIAKKNQVLYYGDLSKKDIDRLKIYFENLIKPKDQKKGR